MRVPSKRPVSAISMALGSAILEVGTELLGVNLGELSEIEIPRESKTKVQNHRYRPM